MAVKVIRLGLEVASHLAVAVISHIGMFIALVQAAMDEQWIEVPNLGIGKKVKLFQKLVLNWMSFNPTESCPSNGEEQMDEDIEGMQYHSHNERDEDEDGTCVSLPRAARTEKNATEEISR